MVSVIESLIVLQERDRKLIRLRSELAHIAPERQDLQQKTMAASTAQDAARLRFKQVETSKGAAPLR